jgi:5-methylcytosine-specific restriction endonuclease McrA
MNHRRRDAIYCSRSCKSMDYVFYKRGKTRYTTIARRRFLYERDNGTCYSCGDSVSADAFELDHLIPVIDGGSSDESNLAVSCRWCNRSRGTKITEAVVHKIKELAQ